MESSNKFDWDLFLEVCKDNGVELTDKYGEIVLWEDNGDIVGMGSGKVYENIPHPVKEKDERKEQCVACHLYNAGCPGWPYTIPCSEVYNEK